MVEQLTLNQRVAGSSPARFTKLFNNLRPRRFNREAAVVVGIVVGGLRFPSQQIAQP